MVVAALEMVTCDLPAAGGELPGRVFKFRQLIQEQDPLCARLTSPGLGKCPPPIRPASEMV